MTRSWFLSLLITSLVEHRLAGINNPARARWRRWERRKSGRPATTLQRVAHATDKIGRVTGLSESEWKMGFKCNQRSLSQQTSGRSSPDSDVPDETNPHPMESILIHKPGNVCNRCTTCDDKGKNDCLSGSASLPAKFSTKCSECSEMFNDPHQTLDVSRMKRNSKIRPTILSPNCDNTDSDAKHWPRESLDNVLNKFQHIFT
jgi:hypothetical protein